ncbi:MAG: mandelate racemase, partial [Myxococcales bacterium]|nr:mandelate racemase [Myxococcales bacterium]
MNCTSSQSHDAGARPSGAPVVDDIRVSVYVIPTDALESDGTAEWNHTTLVLVETLSAGRAGIGWTYADRATAEVVREPLAAVVRGSSLFAVPAMHEAMGRAVRNLGRPGIAAMAIAAVEASAYDAAAKVMGVPLFRLLGACRPAVTAYGSGGFTSYTDERLREQLGGWFAQGFTRVKMKVGREPGRDVARVRAAREVIGDAALFVDANGAYGRKQALNLARPFRELGVVWFEEPVSS